MGRPLYCFLLAVAALSSFTIVTGEDSRDVKTTEDTSSQESSKEKRSGEEILFGNQQNKPNGLVDDMMSMSEDTSNNSKAQAGGKSAEDDEEDWYNTLPAALRHVSDSQPLKALPATTGLYEQYRRKRQLLEHPLPLRKRSLRSSLGQMIQKRGIRIPRRSMRLKRQVDVEDLLNMFGNERYYNEEAQVTPHSFSGRSRTLSKRHIPGRFTGYQETPYPYVFQHTDDGILSSGDEVEDNNDDVDDLLLLPPTSRYIDASRDLVPFRSREEENGDGFQKWLARHTVPSVFRVSRRSSPFFYPIDYRYIPGYKKRSSGSAGLDEEGDFGKWGHVVQIPEAYASADDVARLYGLASLLSEEGDDVRVHPSS